MQGTMPGARRPRRPRTAWMDNINTWTGLPVEESVRMTEDRDKWKKYVYGVPTLGSRMAKEQNRTLGECACLQCARGRPGESLASRQKKRKNDALEWSCHRWMYACGGMYAAWFARHTWNWHSFSLAAVINLVWFRMVHCFLLRMKI